MPSGHQRSGPFIAAALFVAVLIPAPAVHAQSTTTGVFSQFVDFETKLTSWSGGRGFPTTLALTPGSRARGHLWYTSAGGRATYERSGRYLIELTGRFGYYSARQSLPGIATSTFAGPSDSVLGARMTLQNLQGWQPFIGISVNVPTGDAILSQAQRYARMDRDLVGVGNYGEGLNVAVTGGAGFPITESIAGSLAATVTWADSYRRDSASAIGIQVAPVVQRFNPGESLSLAANLNGQHGAFSWSLGGSYTIEDSNKVNGQVVTRIGHSLALSATGGWRWAENALANVSLSYQMTNRNETVPIPPGALIRETSNSNADVFSASIDQWFGYEDWTFGGGFSYRRRFDNGWPPGDQRFIAGHDRIGLSLAAKRQITAALDVTLRAERIWMRYDAQPVANAGPGTVPNSSAPRLLIHGWQVALGAGMKF
ncbi:MAG: hypothetical protein O9322_13005 [Beijerinckiaceae bacterium]|nr:hypothetical protein [Beijerinckiaceae bacterium]MCZ8300261.1 hypothetical protein [Beijerinckiaceae bacterium]